MVVPLPVEVCFGVLCSEVSREFKHSFRRSPSFNRKVSILCNGQHPCPPPKCFDIGVYSSLLRGKSVLMMLASLRYFSPLRLD
ncbi:hypothetical protein SAMN06296036_102285 [Pseudobacteriovorax antillogorgiicola]|uniref:Uncharacterized protein n=1 Tax=Pseudobacteriovorax antillogorgiicola TaxID=1513793 RepID=A0A1Y6BDV1_9BACT|nr:hypothetical protein EDD56_102158 [Pseudobacteriovorax antillogorgiicola]SME96457.1 hypothetical protein SAMN06296036_102285 [Pseudobacteriovorax antillogorgiicola]